MPDDEERPKPQKPPKSPISYLVVRKSVVFLILYILAIEFVYLFLYAVTLVPSVIADVPQRDATLFSLIVYILLGLMVIKLFTTVWIAAVWLNEYYEIHPQEIVHRHGVFTQQREVFTTKDVKSMTIQQSLFGRLLRYGTVILFNPALDQRIQLRNVANPHKHLEMIAQFMPSVEERAVFIRGAGGIATS